MLLLTSHKVLFMLFSRGGLIIRRLCILLNAERVYRELSTILEREDDLEFSSIMVQVLVILIYRNTNIFNTNIFIKSGTMGFLLTSFWNDCSFSGSEFDFSYFN